MAEIMIKPGETAMVNGKPVTNTGCSPMWIGEEDKGYVVGEETASLEFDETGKLAPSSSDYLPAEGAHFLAKNMTKREYFAGKAMNTLTINYPKRDQVEFVADLSVLYADALLKELEK